MRLLEVWGAGILCLLTAVACGSDRSSEGGVTCGPGTVLQGGQCVVAAAAGDTGDSAGASNGCTGAKCNVAGNSSGGGSSSGGGNGGSGGASGDGAALGGSAGDSENTAGSGGNAGSGGSDAGPVPPRWLTFRHEDGAFAYDVTKFPAANALVQLGTGTAGPWSPDGRKVLYGDKGTLYSADMTGATPGAGTLLVTTGASPSFDLFVPPFAWSADSRSIAMVANTTLSVFDSTASAPPIHPITTTLKGYSWAPAGNKMVYTDASGFFVLDVVAGVPGIATPIDTSRYAWAPDGEALAGAKNGNLTLTTLSGNAPVTKTLTAATIASPTIGSISFSPDGSKLVFDGNQDRAHSDVYYVNLTPTPGAATRVNPALSDTGWAYVTAWSADSRWLLYWVTDTAFGYFAINLGGAAPGVPVAIKGTSSQTPVWLATSHQVLAASNNQTLLSSIDVLTPSADPVTWFSGTGLVNFAANPAGSVLAYNTAVALHLRDLAAPQTPAIDVPLGTSSYDMVGAWAWSPDGKFIVVANDYENSAYQLRLLRLDGAIASTPIALHDSSIFSISFAWQP